MLEGKVRVKKEKLSPQEILLKKYGYDVEACPCCKTGKMKIVLHFAAHAPPEHFRKEVMQGKPNA